MQSTKRVPARPRRPLAAFIYDQATTLPDGHTGRLRASLEAHIDRCIAMLDSIDPDPDLEDTGDFEPWLAGDPTNDAGQDIEDDPCDDEPSLGWPDGVVNQSLPRVPETLWSVDCEADESESTEMAA